MIVVDTSAMLAALIGGPVADRLRLRLRDDGDLHAPHLIDVELLHALRQLVARRVLSAHRAQDARDDFHQLTLTRYPHHPLADRIWQLRQNVTAYDASYVALGEALGAPVVTCDARLAGAPGHRAKVEVFPA